MPRLPRPRTEGQRRASIALTNVVFLALVTWLLAGEPVTAADPAPTASVAVQKHGR